MVKPANLFEFSQTMTLSDETIGLTQRRRAAFAK
jgi:hypothetical protein